MVDIPTKEDEKKFTETLRQMADRAQSEVGYSATRFRQLLAERGGFGAAHFLLAKKEPSEGFTSMYMAGRIDLTLECIIQRPEWRRFFESSELSRANTLTGDEKC